MKVNSTYVLSGALVLAGIVALVVRSHLSSAPPPPPPVVVQAPEKTAILVAAKDLHPGDFIDPASLRWDETDKPVSRTFNFVRGKDSQSLLFGATLRETVAEGSALTSNVLVRQNEPGFVAAVLGKGKRAISVPTSAVASNAGLVSPNDRVDVILSIKKDEQPELMREQTRPSWVVSPSTATISVAKPLLASESIVCNLRVLALNNQTDSDIRPRQDVIAEDNLDSTEKSRVPATTSSRQRPISFQTVTLEVTPKQAEILAVAKEVGMLHLAIRSTTPDDTDKTCNRADNTLLSALSRHSSVTSLSQSTDIYNSMSGITVGRQVKTYRAEQKDVVAFPAR
ncbi:Flp pilus assembly protein CpaB [Pectobacterium wasabiae]|uniref:Pilus assembly protein CpaB n=1 Tax=Pectobacterium wasabiae TaxID=55208 RepID=A0AAW3EJY9_9GAMM|nr:Flp pilus assembly protein CpaB [Pectobacterium wasabiae]AOR63947.1 Flp pilus assembly protein CpaB [Pectobacterium wasabiae CFBP 3304]EJS94341.1 Flp pilus assembly protein CpaB [Pectobacterium wasabiae CFBP 3304]KFX08566.1 pilus assembly protein CpaB [Pectobacterium wasabiae]KGA28593.1 pilus assembly protein CpaB [Pectobacterium wasabiae]